MDRATRIFRHDPLTIVEFIVAFWSMIGSIIIMTVSLGALGIVAGTGSAAVAAITSSVGIYVVGCVAVAYSLTNIYGIVRRNLKLRSAALFVQILVRLYALIAIVMIQGLFPPTWIASLTILLVACVCYLTVRRKLAFYRSVT